MTVCASSTKYCKARQRYEIMPMKLVSACHTPRSSAESSSCMRTENHDVQETTDNSTKKENNNPDKNIHASIVLKQIQLYKQKSTRRWIFEKILFLFTDTYLQLVFLKVYQKNRYYLHIELLYYLLNMQKQLN